MTVLVLGGGPAGLGLVHGLVEASDERFVAIERAAALGGLAQTVRWGDHGCHDLGPHKLFTKDTALMARVEALLSPDGWLTRPKRSSIYLRGRFLPYPPSPFALAGVFGVPTLARMSLDYAAARFRGAVSAAAPPRTFEEDLERRVGHGLYRALFEPIARKLWGDPRQLDVKLSRGRVQTPGLGELVRSVLGRRSSSAFEALTFRYPKGGLGRLWDAIARRTERQGQYLLGHELVAIRSERRTVRALACRDRATDARVEIEVGPDDFVFSTLPLAKLAELLGGTIREETRRAVSEVLTLNDLLLVFLKADVPSLIDESWVFVPDPDVAFHRVSEQESFDPEMTPHGSIVCCELMSSETRRLAALSDTELVGAAQSGLARMGYRDFRVEDARVIRLPASYPVFRPGYQQRLDAILAELDAFENLRTIGRQGAFNYIGSLDALDIGFGAARWFVERGARADRWSGERERTAHYPVLD